MKSFSSVIRQFPVPETGHQVIVDHTDGLHMGVDNGCAHEGESPPFKIFRYASQKGVLAGISLGSWNG